MREIKFDIIFWDGSNKNTIEHVSCEEAWSENWIEFSDNALVPTDECTIIRQYTGYEMRNKEVFFGDLVSNNYHTDKEVIREVVMYEGRMMLRRIKGKSSLPKYIELHSHGSLNYEIIGNIHEAVE